MCGIVAIYAYGAAAVPVDRGELGRIRDHMIARGPDGQGAWFADDGRVGLGHRRLAVIDLSERGAQPMPSADGRFVVTFNGEIYNHAQLRRGLEQDGAVFASDSDTEVLLHLYAREGTAMLDRLRGMFTLAIWDDRLRTLLLARDPYGIKPLYYSDRSGTFRAASQVKALLAGGALSREPNAAGHAGFFLSGSLPEPHTLYRDIRALPAGHWMTVGPGGPGRPQEYFSLSRVFTDAAQDETPALGADDLQEQVREALLDSVRHHCVADVPVGAFLSAGVDSAALVGLMRDCGQEQVQTVTLAFEEFKGSPADEAPLAQSSAAHYATRHTTHTVTRNEFRDDVQSLLGHMDQPSIDGINTWMVSKATHAAGLKVAISGVGGDELFGGYPSFTSIPRWVKLLTRPSKVPGAAAGWRGVGTWIGRHAAAGPKLGGLLTYGGSYPGAYFLQRGLFMPWELSTVMPPDLARDGVRQLSSEASCDRSPPAATTSSYAIVAELEASFYLRNQLLRDADWASMAHSLEVRTPLVDATLLTRLAPVLVKQAHLSGKRLLGRSPSKPLPTSLIERPKTGFGIPTASWTREIPGLDAWREVDSLRVDRCPWARRWAYSVYAEATGSA